MAAAKKTTAKEPAKKVGDAGQEGPGQGAAAKKAAAASPPPDAPTTPTASPPRRGTTKDGIAYTKDFDVKFLKAQHDALISERGRAHRPGHPARGRGQLADRGRRDGRRAVRRRERRGRHDGRRARARSRPVGAGPPDGRRHRRRPRADGATAPTATRWCPGAPIPRERLEAIPWATVLVEEKVGGIGRR